MTRHALLFFVVFAVVCLFVCFILVGLQGPYINLCS